jgi:hypothetical protein
MPITLTIAADSIDDLRNQLLKLLLRAEVSDSGTPEPAQTAIEPGGPAVEQSEPAPSSTGNGSAAAAEPAQEEKAAPAPRGSGKQGNVSAASGKAAKGKAQAQAAQNTPKLERTDVRRALTSYLALHDEPATAKLLKQFGKVDKLSELAEERFQAVYDAAMA